MLSRLDLVMLKICFKSEFFKMHYFKCLWEETVVNVVKSVSLVTDTMKKKQICANHVHVLQTVAEIAPLPSSCCHLRLCFKRATASSLNPSCFPAVTDSLSPCYTRKCPFRVSTAMFKWEPPSRIERSRAAPASL